MAMSLTIDGAQRGHAFISIIVIQAVFVEQEVVNTNEQYHLYHSIVATTYWSV